MKYTNAKTVLPDQLIEELQKYVQAGYLYIPAKADHHRSWGEKSGFKKELENRNARIIEEYRNGAGVDELADRYYLSVHAIRKIVYRK